MFILISLFVPLLWWYCAYCPDHPTRDRKPCLRMGSE